MSDATRLPAMASDSHHPDDAPYPWTAPPGGRVVPSERVAAVEHEGRLVLLDAAGGRRVRLDAFGSRVWALLERQPTMPALVVALREEGMRTEHLAEDVARLLARWTLSGVVTWR